MMSLDRTEITKDITKAAERGLVNVKKIGTANYFAITEKGEDLIRKLFDKYKGD
jgi:predicted transcriptional regulator